MISTESQRLGMTSELRVVTANVLRGNPDSERLVEWLRHERPDVFVILELDARFRDQLQLLATDYPYRVELPRADNFGIGLYSRHPLSAHETRPMWGGLTPAILATVDVPAVGAVALLATHPLPPVGRNASDSRNATLLADAEWIARQSGPKLLAGDLNITPWSPHFQDLLMRSGLRDSSRDFSLQPTWPSLAWPFRIPIDHVLVSDDLTVVAHRLGPDVGSDHRPVLVEVRAS